MKSKKKKYRFFERYLDDGERIIEVAHRHILVYKINAAKTSFFGVTLPLILYFFFFQTAIWFFGIWVFVGLFGLGYHFINWYFDAWLLTNFGVVDIDRDGFFNMSSTRVDYHMIEGISYTINGFWRTVFNYGQITIDKLGSKTSVMLEDAANPKYIERKVLEYQERFVAEKSIKDHSTLKTMLADMIAYHAQQGKISLPEE
ncbi:MAG: hypothetical protein AAB373_05880 [Patescibacteria group bacterium]